MVQDNKVKQETWIIQERRLYAGCLVIQKNASHKYLHCHG